MFEADGELVNSVLPVKKNSTGRTKFAMMVPPAP
jgi:hypothetical protein